ncbi:unnamed protein product [Amoebophrya sp. A120]|nr:unnamed protein product [Amoebophrya sp. A120]|eukprot:GSA120T00007839001.1
MVELHVLDLAGTPLRLSGDFRTGAEVRQAVAEAKRIPVSLCLLYWDPFPSSSPARDGCSALGGSTSSSGSESEFMLERYDPNKAAAAGQQISYGNGGGGPPGGCVNSSAGGPGTTTNSTSGDKVQNNPVVAGGPTSGTTTTGPLLEDTLRGGSVDEMLTPTASTTTQNQPHGVLTGNSLATSSSSTTSMSEQQRLRAGSHHTTATTHSHKSDPGGVASVVFLLDSDIVSLPSTSAAASGNNGNGTLLESENEKASASPPTLRLIVTTADFSDFPRQPQEPEWRALSESGIARCRDYVFQEEYRKVSDLTLPQLLRYLANRTGFDNLLEAYVEDEQRTPTSAWLDVQGLLYSSPPGGGGSSPDLLKLAEKAERASSKSSSPPDQPDPAADTRTQNQQGQPTSAMKNANTYSPKNPPAIPKQQRKWPALFFLLRKAEFSPRIRTKLLHRSDCQLLLNFVHPETCETCLILGGLFSGKQFLLDMLAKIQVTTSCVNAVSNLCSESEKTCATCLANFFQVGCFEGFEEILKRDDLELEMLAITYNYLKEIGRKYAETQRNTGRKPSKKLDALGVYLRKVKERLGGMDYVFSD